MRVAFIYPAFERHAQSHPELLECVPCNEYLGSPSLGIAMVAACTPEGWDVSFHDDRVRPFDAGVEADLYALSVFTPAATRAFEIADELRARGKLVVMGGIFPTAMPDEAARHADAVVVGEGEAVWGALCEDARQGALRPRYDVTEPPDLETLPLPRLDLYFDAEDPAMRPDDYPLQISRGCPLACDACILPLSMGKKLRTFPLEACLGTARSLARARKLVCLTEDTATFPYGGVRRRFRSFLDAVSSLEEENPIRISYLGISMPLVQSLDPDLVAAMKRAGIGRFYLVCGFDDVTRTAFGRGDPKSMARAEACVRTCLDNGIEPYTSLLVGNEEDDEGVFDRILEFAERTRIPKSEFAIFTPYPGTPAWHRLEAEGRILDRTWRRYNDANVVFRPRQMTPERLVEGYMTLWREFYRSRQHLANLPREERTIQF